MKMYGNYSYSITACPFLFRISETARHTLKAYCARNLCFIILHYRSSLPSSRPKRLACKVHPKLFAYIFNDFKEDTWSGWHVQLVCQIKCMANVYGACLRTVSLKWNIWQQCQIATLSRFVQQAVTQTPSCLTIAIAWLFSQPDRSN